MLRYRIHFDDGHTTILTAHELLTVSASGPMSLAERPRFYAYGSIQLLVRFAALPRRVLGGRSRGRTASVFASADCQDRVACPTGQAQRSCCGPGPWAKTSKGDHEMEECYAKVERRLRARMSNAGNNAETALPSVA